MCFCNKLLATKCLQMLFKIGYLLNYLKWVQRKTLKTLQNSLRNIAQEHLKKILQEGTLQTKYEEIKVALRLLHSTVWQIIRFISQVIKVRVLLINAQVVPISLTWTNGSNQIPLSYQTGYLGKNMAYFHLIYFSVWLLLHKPCAKRFSTFWVLFLAFMWIFAVWMRTSF